MRTHTISAILALCLVSGTASAFQVATVPSAADMARGLIDYYTGLDARPSHQNLVQLKDLAAAFHRDLTPQQQAALAAAGPVAPNHPALVNALRAGASGPALVEAATRAQAEVFGWTLPEPSTATHSTPSGAAFAFLSAEGVIPSPEQAERLRALDARPAAQAAALARTVSSFAALEVASERMMTQGGSGADVLAARLAFFDAALDLEDAFRDGVPTTQMSMGIIDVPPLLFIDLEGRAWTYIQNYALSIDVGGNDLYYNNAGGTWVGNCALPTYAAAAVDLTGNDKWNDGTYRAYDCGKNGGSMGGVGALIDLGGSDLYGYDGMDKGSNGGGNGAASWGFLYDAEGTDHYRAGAEGTNGGGYESGMGLLMDVGSFSDTFGAHGRGTNGGAYATFGATTVGMMIVTDANGNAQDHGTNGGGSGVGAYGFLSAGQGSFNAWGNGVNGGGYASGAGTVLGGASFQGQSYGVNGGGDELGTGYAEGSSFWGSQYGVNGGGSNGGRGTVIGAGGLSAHSYGVNGGAWGEGSSGWASGIGSATAWGGNGANGGADDNGVGFLFGAGYHTGTGEGVNGGASEGGIGTLVDTGLWSSGYSATGGQGVNGGAYAGSSALLIDAFGNDAYAGGERGSNGGSHAGGHAMLIDLGGDDTYTCTGPSCNGGNLGAGGSALLLDVGAGNDSYNGNNNETTVPKGNGGSQIDA